MRFVGLIILWVALTPMILAIVVILGVMLHASIRNWRKKRRQIQMGYMSPLGWRNKVKKAIAPVVLGFVSAGFILYLTANSTHQFIIMSISVLIIAALVVTRTLHKWVWS